MWKVPSLTRNRTIGLSEWGFDRMALNSWCIEDPRVRRGVPPPLLGDYRCESVAKPGRLAEDRFGPPDDSYGLDRVLCHHASAFGLAAGCSPSTDPPASADPRARRTPDRSRKRTLSGLSSVAR